MSSIKLSYDVDISPAIDAANSEVLEILEDGREERVEELSGYVKTYYKTMAKKEISRQVDSAVREIVRYELDKIMDAPFRKMVRKEITAAIQESKTMISEMVAEKVEDVGFPDTD